MSKALEHGLTALELLAQGPKSAAEIAQHLSVDRTTGWRILRVLVEQLVPAFRVLRQELFNFRTNLRIGARESCLAAFTGRVVQLLNLLPALRSQESPQK